MRELKHDTDVMAAVYTRGHAGFESFFPHSLSDWDLNTNQTATVKCISMYRVFFSSPTAGCKHL